MMGHSLLGRILLVSLLILTWVFIFAVVVGLVDRFYGL